MNPQDEEQDESVIDEILESIDEMDWDQLNDFEDEEELIYNGDVDRPC